MCTHTDNEAFKLKQEADKAIYCLVNAGWLIGTPKFDISSPYTTHVGPCYPCPLPVDVKCFCGATVLTLPCGREKVTKPPKCAELCR